jgi:multidrug efflux pump subunit AcrA (membrane-fusion protein)
MAHPVKTRHLNENARVYSGMSITSKFLKTSLFLLGFSTMCAQADNVITVGVAPHGGYVILGGTVIPLKEVTLTAQMPGVIKSIAGEEGDTFKAGTMLLKIDDDELRAKKASAQAALNSAMSGLQNAQVQYTRELWNPRVNNPRPMYGMAGPAMFDRFFDNGLVNDNNDKGMERHADLVTQGTQVQTARSNIAQAQASIRELDSKIADTESIAPFDGVIIDKLVEVGDTVQPGQPLLVYAYSKFLRIKAEVPARLMPGLQKDMVVPARLDVGNTQVNARVAQIAPSANGTQHTVTVKFDLPEGVPGGPGMYAEVMIPDVNSPTRALPVIPKSAIIKRGSLPSVKVLDEDNVPRMRLIRTGIELDANNVIVLSGLQPGERILTNSDTPKTPIPWDEQKK